MSRINTNVPSLVAARVLANNNERLNTALERLSTGLRINRGKDDPAGLIASETLRSEMTALSAAISNSRRADNMVSVAEGGLGEVSALLVELENLVGNSANKAGLGADELAANQLQIDSILDTINRIATSTEFGGRKLLNGSLDYTTSGVSTGAGASAITGLRIDAARVPVGGHRSVTVEVTDAASTGLLVYAGTATGAGTTTIQVGGKHGTEVFSFASGTAAAGVIAAINGSKDVTGVSATISGAGADMRIKFNSVDYGSDAFVSVEALSGTFATTSGGSAATQNAGSDAGVKINGMTAVTHGLTATVRSAALSVEVTLAQAFGTQTALSKTFEITGGGAEFSIGPTVGVNTMASLGIQAVTTGAMGEAGTGFLASLGSGQENDLAGGNIESAQRIVRAANSQVAALRGRLGAFQKNTLASTINALEVAFENVSAAESAIRDADFAAETSQLTRSQILAAAATQTLQMANAAPQSVLALLR